MNTPTNSPRTGEDAQLSKGDVEFLLLTACDQISKLERKNAALVAALAACVDSMLREYPNGMPVQLGRHSEEQDWNSALNQARAALAAARNA